MLRLSNGNLGGMGKERLLHPSCFSSYAQISGLAIPLEGETSDWE